MPLYDGTKRQAWADLNCRRFPYQESALPAELQACMNRMYGTRTRESQVESLVW